ncbi:MAG: dihydroorotate dehydrogenase [Bacillota bacterium]
MVRPDLAVEIAGISMKNPVMDASGTFGFGTEYRPLMDISRLGALVTKSVTLEPVHGNPPPRIWETAGGMLNSIGLQNPGLKSFLANKLPLLQSFNLPVIVNIAGKKVEEYVQLAAAMEQAPGVAGLEVNISCPNVKEGGIAFGADPSSAEAVTKAVRAACSLPVIVKLSPNVTDITVIARAVAEAGASAISLINTLTGMAIDHEKRRPILGNVSGGLSGPAVKPVALYQVWRVCQAVRIPVIGMGGIMNAGDAIQFMLAGASAVAVGAANFVQPGVMLEIIDGIEDYLVRHRIPRVGQLVGALEIS